MLRLAEEAELLKPISNRNTVLRISTYADDAAIFANPYLNEIQAIQQILEVFGEASDLRVNLNKCAVYPIQCQWINAAEIM